MKLWIKKRLEELRNNSTTGSTVSTSTTMETTTNKIGLISSSTQVTTTTTTTITTTPATTNLECPDIYKNDVESKLLCKLWKELQTLLSSNPDNQRPSGSLGVSPLLVLCPYKTNPTSASLLCQLWCQIQTFFNKVLYHDDENYIMHTHLTNVLKPQNN